MLPCAFAVDGVVLINQSTVIAQGGFPYVISTAGSYKLSGKLTAPLNTNAVVVSASNVALDLNGLSVECFSNGTVRVSCLIGSALHDVVIRNGSVSASLVGTPPGFYALFGINFSAIGQGIAPSQVTLEDLQVRVIADQNDVFGANTSWGPNSKLKGNTFTSNIPQASLNVSCPSLLAENVNATEGPYKVSVIGCVTSANMGIN